MSYGVKQDRPGESGTEQEDHLIEDGILTLLEVHTDQEEQADEHDLCEPK